jgi:hypothetical protein
MEQKTPVRSVSSRNVGDAREIKLSLSRVHGRSPGMRRSILWNDALLAKRTKGKKRAELMKRSE